MEQNKTREYTLKQRILTLFAIAIGIAFAWGVCGEYMWSGEPETGSAMFIYGGFWLAMHSRLLRPTRAARRWR